MSLRRTFFCYGLQLFHESRNLCARAIVDGKPFQASGGLLAFNPGTDFYARESEFNKGITI
jgi:hypothetical protein